MIDYSVIKLFAKAENSIILCYNLKLKKVTHSYYGDKDMLLGNPVTPVEYSELLSKTIDIVIDNNTFLNTVRLILAEKDVFNFPDIYKTTSNQPIKVNFRGGRIDSENVLVNIYQDKINEELDAKKDELTKCVSYEYYKKQVDKLIKAKTPFVSGVMDIDNFKEFNIKYNHILGDIALIEAASVVKEICGKNGLVCRHGGDEFYFFYKMDNDYDNVHKFITDFKERVETAINEIVNKPEKITITVGLSRFPLDGDNYKLLTIKNKTALIRGKKKARNCFIIYLEEKCGYVDEKTIVEKAIDRTTGESAQINILTGVLEVLNNNSSLKKRIEDSISLIGMFFYLDRIVVTETNPDSKLNTDLIVWHNPRSEKKPAFQNSDNIKIWKKIYEESNLLVVNSIEEGKALPVAKILSDSNISACVAIELKHEGRLYGQIRFEMTSIDRLWQPTDISSFVLIAKVISIKYDKDYQDYIHQKEMYFDSITDVYNLQKWFIEGEKYIQNNKSSIFSILDIEIYDFVSIMNIFGAQAIVKILKTISSFLQMFVGYDVIYGRTSDNRFTLLFPGNDIDQMGSFFRELREYVKNSVRLEKGDVLLQAGVFVNDKNYSLGESVDKAVIARKFGSKFDDVTVFSNIMYEKEIARLELESHIEKALERNEFVLYLQPKISTKDKKLAGAEALSRWNYNFERLVFPNDFIPILEKNGYVSRLDFNVFENVCKFQRELLDNDYQVVPISVNVSRSVKNFDKYLEEIEAIRKKYDVSASLIEIEITEGMYTDNNEIIRDFIFKLHSIGYKVSMDDFGSGYSNITALSQLNFDTIKFDRSFLSTPTNEKETLIITVMTKLVKQLNMNVLCEGVETEEYERYLTEIGCDYIQGYYYDKPLPLDKFKEKYIKKN